MQIIGRKHFVGDISLVEIYVFPLAALCLVAGDGVCIFYLNGIKITVGFDTFNAVGFQWNVGIVVHDLLIEFFVLLRGECRRLSEQTVKYDGGLQFVVVVVGQLQPNFRKM